TLRRGRGMTSMGTMLRLGLVGGQVAVATILVVGALLLIQSFAQLQSVSLGFKPDHLLTASISIPDSRYPTPEKVDAFFRTLLSEVQDLPGVVSTGLTSGIPMGGGFTSMPVVPVSGPPGVPEQDVRADWRMVSVDYLRTLQVPLRRGRYFEESDARRPV